MLVLRALLLRRRACKKKTTYITLKFSEFASQNNYFIVDCCNDSCSYSHADDKGTVEVLVKEQGLHECSQKEAHSVQVAVPVGLSLILCELYHQPEAAL